MLPPYLLSESDDDVTVEFRGLPFWIDASDVRVQATDTTLKVRQLRYW